MRRTPVWRGHRAMPRTMRRTHHGMVAGRRAVAWTITWTGAITWPGTKSRLGWPVGGWRRRIMLRRTRRVMGGTIGSSVGGLSGTIYTFSGAISLIAGIAWAGRSVDSRAGTVALGTGIVRARWSVHSGFRAIPLIAGVARTGRSAHSCAGTVS